MLSMRSRRRVAAVAVAVFAVVSGTLTFIVTREYSPDGLRKRAAAAFESATGHRVRLGAARVSLDGAVSFEGAAVMEGDARLLSAGEVIVTGLPRPILPWRPKAVAATQVTLHIDLSDAATRLEPLTILAELLSRSNGVKLTAPEFVTVEVAAPGEEPSRYLARTDGFLAQRRLEITRVGQAVDAKAKDACLFVATPEAITLDADAARCMMPLAQAIARNAGAPVWSAVDAPMTGRFAARWTTDAASVTFTNAAGWRVTDPAATSGLTAPLGELAVMLDSAAVAGGRVTAADGTVALRADRMTAAQAAGWLEAFGIVGGAGGAPAVLEGAHFDAAFAYRDGAVTVRPVAGKPGLVWRETEAGPVVVFSGSGEADLESLKAASAALAAAAEAETVEAPSAAQGESPAAPEAGESESAEPQPATEPAKSPVSTESTAPTPASEEAAAVPVVESTAASAAPESTGATAAAENAPAPPSTPESAAPGAEIESSAAAPDIESTDGAASGALSGQ